MLLEFLYPLVRYFTTFNVFKYLTFRSAYAALTTLLVCYLFGPSIIEALRRLKVGQSIRNDGPVSHLKKVGTPTMGGLMIILSVTLASLLWQDLASFKMWITLGAFLAFGAIGFADDYLKVTRKNSDGLSVSVKFSLQTVVALAIALILYYCGGEETTAL